MPHDAAQRATTAVVYHPDYLSHRVPRWHPERPQRLEAIVEHLKDVGLWEALAHVAPEPAPVEAVARVHSPDYVRQVEALCQGGGGLLDWGDTPVGPASYRVALLAAGGVLRAADAVMAGQAENAFALVRPPGHHARADRGMGFCIFNNVAIAARHLQNHHGLGRILIADWDVHHGNGTCETFYADPSVYFVSVHRSPFYPGTGAAGERGSGEGEGTIAHVPVPGGTSGEAMVRAFGRALEPAAKACRPDFVLVSAGFDGHREDPLGGMAMEDEHFAAMARQVKDVARTYCQGRLVATLEGGYHLEAQARSVEAVLRVLAAQDATAPSGGPGRERAPGAQG
ncbi:MAG: histone deacetylase [Candidatus Brocadiia bacterium]